MSLSGKLKLKTELPLYVYAAPAEAADLFADLELKNAAKGKGPFAQVLFFAGNKKDIDALFDKITASLAADAVFWIAYPKQSGNMKSDLIRNEGWDTVFKSDYQIVSSASIDDNWTAVRIRRKDPNAKYKSDVPMEERITEGVDYVKRTVQLPKDAVAAMKGYKGLEDFFNSMSFSHKREYAEAIAEAKKPETRARRIEKMVEMVQKIKERKEQKKK